MNEPSVVIRYMAPFHPVDAPQEGDACANFAHATQRFTEDLGCEDGHRSHFEVRYGRRTFYVYIRSPLLRRLQLQAAADNRIVHLRLVIGRAIAFELVS